MEVAMALQGVWTDPVVVLPRHRRTVTANLRFLRFLQDEYAREREIVSSMTAIREESQSILDKKILFRTNFHCQIVATSTAPSEIELNTTATHHHHLWHPPTESEDAICQICLEDYLPGEVVCCSKRHICNHVFHKDCMEKWMMVNPCCPLCRVDLMTNIMIRRKS